MLTITQDIPLNRLVHSKSNVRKTGRHQSLDALMASIEAHGLRQNLNVKPTTGNRFEVVAGGRRLEALKRLMKDGKLQADTSIPCVVLNDNDDPAEISLVENTMREAMHPDDQCSAFKALIEGGASDEDVGARFGITATVVRQRLKLASVSPVLRKLFRAGRITLDQMMAFALVDDHARQEAVWNDLPDWNNDADAIRRNLTEESVTVDEAIAQFVGIEAYEAEGGIVLHDLFDQEQPAIMTDAALVERIAMRKLEEEAAYLKAEGWQWVKVALTEDYLTHYDRVYPVQGEEGTAVFAATDLARAGARVTLQHNGKLRIERGLVDAATIKAERRAAVKSGNAPASSALPDAVVEDLTAHRTAALRLSVARSPFVGLASVVHALALRLVYDSYSVRSCLDITAHETALAPLVKSKAECVAHEQLDGLSKDIVDSLPDEPSALWDWCLQQTVETLIVVIAYLGALTIDAVVHKGGSVKPHAEQIAKAVGLDMHQHWTPSANGFFVRLPKAVMFATLAEIGEGRVAARVLKLKKVEAAQVAAWSLMDHQWLPTPLLNTEPVIATGEDVVDDGEHDVEDMAE